MYNKLDEKTVKQRIIYLRRPGLYQTAVCRSLSTGGFLSSCVFSESTLTQHASDQPMYSTSKQISQTIVSTDSLAAGKGAASPSPAARESGQWGAQ